ncbi:AraC family transcriptional regulator [Phocaeicola plebeius]
MINSENYSLAEISDLTGFSSIAYFRQCFKDEYGMAPTKYLKKKRK